MKFRIQTERLKMLTFIDACVGVSFVRQKVIRPCWFLKSLNDLVKSRLGWDGKIIANVCIVNYYKQRIMGIYEVSEQRLSCQKYNRATKEHTAFTISIPSKVHGQSQCIESPSFAFAITSVTNSRSFHTYN